MVSDVDVITAKRCPVRDILSANRGSFSADPDGMVSFPVSPVMNLLSCSTGLMPGVMGVIGVRGIVAPSCSSSALPAAPMLGVSTRDPLPSVVSRDSASSSDSSMRSLEDLLLLAA